MSTKQKTPHKLIDNNINIWYNKDNYLSITTVSFFRKPAKNSPEHISFPTADYPDPTDVDLALRDISEGGSVEVMEFQGSLASHRDLLRAIIDLQTDTTTSKGGTHTKLVRWLISAVKKRSENTAIPAINSDVLIVSDDGINLDAPEHTSLQADLGGARGFHFYRGIRKIGVEYESIIIAVQEQTIGEDGSRKSKKIFIAPDDSYSSQGSIDFYPPDTILDPAEFNTYSSAKNSTRQVEVHGISDDGPMSASIINSEFAHGGMGSVSSAMVFSHQTGEFLPEDATPAVIKEPITDSGKVSASDAVEVHQHEQIIAGIITRHLNPRQIIDAPESSDTIEPYIPIAMPVCHGDDMLGVECVAFDPTSTDLKMRDLRSIIYSDSISDLTMQDRLILLRDVFSGMQWLLERGIIHRDIKPANIALTHHQGQLRAKLIDFGISHFDPYLADDQYDDLYEDLPYEMTPFTYYTKCGTPDYLNDLDWDQHDNNPPPSSDIYAASILAIQLFTGHHRDLLSQHGDLLGQTDQMDHALSQLLDLSPDGDFSPRSPEAITHLATIITSLTNITKTYQSLNTTLVNNIQSAAAKVDWNHKEKNTELMTLLHSLKSKLPDLKRQIYIRHIQALTTKLQEATAIPEEIRTLIIRGLSITEAGRPEASDFITALDQALHEDTTQRGITPEFTAALDEAIAAIEKAETVLPDDILAA